MLGMARRTLLKCTEKPVPDEQLGKCKSVTREAWVWSLGLHILHMTMQETHVQFEHGVVHYTGTGLL